MTSSVVASGQEIVLLDSRFTTFLTNSHKSVIHKSYDRRSKGGADPRKDRVAGRHLSDSKRVLKLSLSGACTVNHAHAVGVVRQPRFAARQPPPSCPSTVANTRKPIVVSQSASPEASNVLGLPLG